MEKDLKQIQEIWDAFLLEWPLERLRGMTLQEYSQAGQSHTFTSWIESRLDKLGSIWGGSSFKFGIYSRKNKTLKKGSASDSYTRDYAWYTKYGATPEEAFARVKSLVVRVAEAAASANYAVIDALDLGEAYKWKIAFHYQDRGNPGVIAVFKPKRLQAWLRGRAGSIPQRTSELYRSILSLRDNRDLIALSKDVWEQTVTVDDEKAEGEGMRPGDFAVEQPLNLILYGPPGTGKTYETAELAVGICDGVQPESREALSTRYRELRNLRRIRFVTFHPSFSYEEFVEGIRPSIEDGQVHYEVRAGIFKQTVAYARELFEKREAVPSSFDLTSRRLYKMSLGDSTRVDEAWIYPDCLENSYICLGFGDGTDFSGCDTLPAVRDRYPDPGDGSESFGASAVHCLKNLVQPGDLILVSQGNSRFRAIAEVTGGYSFEPREAGYDQRRPVRWLWSTSAESLPVDMVFSKRLSQMTIYLMDQKAVKWPALRELLSPRRPEAQAPNCVLIIDEINRANLAKTFGELITLLEPSKRLGRPDEQEAELPYSGDRLCVPPNLYVIGTMNTADRSIALMDTALRRRFAFREMTPQAELLAADVAGVDVRALLTSMNERIERLFDRDHILGHTYLLGVASFEELAQRFQSQIIPLLQEYFFEDWRRIQEVFNDLDQPRELQIVQDLDPSGAVAASRQNRRRYRVNPDISPAAVQKIYS
ncbi:MAG TPA: AAA family ATPase [Thermoanaerobaculia bacterium]|jgi:5-methylcytosine-specific restriction protein B|nr:AAA family ATPase [Thermoanaerobaculia bacterium]